MRVGVGPWAAGRLALAAAPIALVLACALPGATLGTYAVTGNLEADTCGGAPNPWTFDVLLWQKDATLFCSRMDASPILSGPIDPFGHATLTGSQLHNVDSTATSAGPCNLERSDDFELTLGQGSPPSSFSGSVTYTFTPQTGANCSDQLAPSGGTYEALPCTIRYTVQSTRQ